MKTHCSRYNKALYIDCDISIDNSSSHAAVRLPRDIRKEGVWVRAGVG